MQPQEPSPVPQPPASEPVVPPAGVARPKLKSRRVRLWLAMGLGLMLLLCLGGVGVVVSLYDGATQIKRSAPDAVVDNFLRAYLVDRDDKEASLYTCKSGLELSSLRAYRNDTVSREKDFSVGIRVSWSSLTVATNGDKGTVTAELTRTTADRSGREANSWQIDVVNQDGWRVCGATKLS